MFRLTFNLFVFTIICGLLFQINHISIKEVNADVWNVDQEGLEHVVESSLPINALESTLYEYSNENDAIQELKLEDDDYYASSNSGLCVEPEYCSNTDGSGVVEPRKGNRNCPKRKILCPIEQLENYPLCGISKPNLIHERILSTKIDVQSKFAEWPWLGIVLESHSKVDYYLCSAVLIDNRHLLTVAHCLDNLDSTDIVVRLGEYNTREDSEPLPSKDVEAEIIVIHQNYTSRNLYNDIAVIRLKYEIQFSENISPICLPNPIQVRKQLRSKEPTKCMTTGWGKDSDTGGFYSEIPKKVSIPLVGNRKCQSMLRQTKLGSKFMLHRGFICAGGEEHNDACVGDGGGPLMCQQDDGTFVLVGLVSWGIGCGQADVPGVYTNVAEFMEFIDKTISFLDEHA